MSENGQGAGDTGLREVLPKAGLVYSEKGNLSEVLCKPKIMPIKSITLQKLEEMEQKAKDLGKIDMDAATIAVANQIRSNAEDGESSGRQRQKAGEVDRLDLS
eukprot:g1876.t1